MNMTQIWITWRSIMVKVTFNTLLLLFVTMFSQLPMVVNAGETIVSEYTIKAAFIYKLARFTEWNDNSNELNVCVYGDDPFGANIDRLSGKQSNGRTIKIIRTKLIEKVSTCHIAFLNILPPEQHMFEKVLFEIKGANVLTVADTENVINFGVMVGVIIDNDKVSFEVNHSQAKESDVEISAQLLRLAKKVI